MVTVHQFSWEEVSTPDIAHPALAVPPAPLGPPPWEEPAPLVQLERLLWGFEGLAELLDPDRALDGTERGNVSHLVLLLSERLEHLLHAIRTDRATLRTALHAARTVQGTTPSDAGANHV